MMHSSPRMFAAMLILLGACESTSSDTVASAPAETAAPRVFGQVQGDGSVTALADIVAEPARFDGQRVRTEGAVERVCQKRGCWLELADASGNRAFVPMAGHSFTVPAESVGEDAVIEGTVHLRERSQAEVDHLKSDGAGDRIPAVSIEATGVVIR